MANTDKTQLEKISGFNLLDAESNIVCAKAGFGAKVFGAADDQKRIMLWKLHKPTPKMTLTGSPSDIKGVTFSLDSRNVYAGTDGGSVYGWDLASTKYCMKLSGHLTTCNFVEVSTEEEDMHMMITGSGDTNIKVWDLRSGKASHTFKNHSKAVNCAKFSPDGNWVASGGADGNTYITDIRTEKVVHGFEEEGQSITSLEFNPKTYTMSTGGAGKRINYYDLENFEAINRMSFNTSPIKDIKFYNRDEYEVVEWGFFGGDDYIRLVNCERNSQGNIYTVPHDTLHDVIIDLKNELLTCLGTYKSDMAFWGVSLPQVANDENETDMQVDQEKYIDSQKQYTDPVDARMTKGPSPSKNYEEYKVNDEFENKAVSQPRNDSFRSSQTDTHAVPPAKGDDLDRTTFSQMENLDRTTFKPNSDNTPAGIDFDEFTSKPSSRDLEDIEKVLDKHFHFADSLKQRHQKIKNILSLYSPYKNVNMTLSALEQMNDMGVTNDIGATLFAEGDFLKNLTMKQGLNALPHCEHLFNGKHENHVVTGAKSIHRILKHIGQDIITVRNYPVTKGVDLQREERLKVCDDILEMFLAIFKGATISKRVKYKGNIGKVSKSLYNDLYNFLALSDSAKGGGRQLEAA